MTLASAFPPAIFLALLGAVLLYTSGSNGASETLVKRAALTLESRAASIWWTNKEISELKKFNLSNVDNNAKTDFAAYELPSASDRVRFGSSEVWLPKLGEVAKSSTMFRPKAPLHSDYKQMGSPYLQAPLPGQFSAGSDEIFIMYKTGADTMWKRGVPHFMMTFPKYRNIALYSDTSGSMLGYEVHDILMDMPSLAQFRQQESSRHRAHMQMHDENWGWDPAKLDAWGGWNMDKFKNLPILYDAYMRNPDCDWYFMMDDDSYIFHDNLVRYLGTLDPNKIYYTGNPGNHWGDDHWIPFAHGGSGIICSRGLVAALFGPDKKSKESNQDMLEKWAKRGADLCCGDILLGECIYRELGHHMDLPHVQTHYLVGLGGPFQSSNLAGLVVRDDFMCNPLITFHHLELSEMETLYQYERMWDADRYITYNDYYRDFMLPYIVEERPNWKLVGDHFDEWFWPGSSEQQEHINLNAGSKEWQPAKTKSDCKDSCSAYPECGAWSWREGHCIHSNAGLIFGRASNSFNHDEHWVTGYQVDRIREWRNKAPCDPLERDANGNWNDNEKISEGWYLRALAAAKESERYTFSPDDSSVPGLAPKAEPKAEEQASEFAMPVFAPTETVTESGESTEESTAASTAAL